MKHELLDHSSAVPAYVKTEANYVQTSFWQSQWLELKKVFIHVPFAVPIKNLYNGYLLYQVGFGTAEFKDHKTVEKIQHEAGMNGMQESFNEAAPQAIVQLVIIFSTGRISYAQMASIPFSIFSLSWASSRVFFILRTRDESDPDPNFKTTFLRILPWELMIVTNSTILWTLIGGLLGKYTFIGVLLSFIAILGVLYAKEWANRINSDTETQENDEEDFKLRAALTSIWLPSVVGAAESNLYFTASVVSLVNKILLLATAVLLVCFTNIDTKPFLLWCKDMNDTTRFSNTTTEESIALSENVTIETPWEMSGITYCEFPADALPTCWNWTEVGMHHKIRICGETKHENYLRLGILLLVAVTSVLSILSSNHLRKISNYIKLYEETKKILCCIETRPEIHRSVVFSLSEHDKNSKRLQEMLTNANPSKNILNQPMNRPNRLGDTPLHNSTKGGASVCTMVLLKAGAIPRKNSANALPEIGEHLYNEEVIRKLQEAKGKGWLPNHLLIALKKQAKRGRSDSDSKPSPVKYLLDHLLTLVGEGSYIAKQNCTLWNYVNEGGTAMISKYDFVEVNFLSRNLVLDFKS